MFVMNGVDLLRWAATEYIRINTVNPGYNVSLIDTLYVAAGILHQLISHCFQ
jgi:hypothetical protein